MAEWWVTLWSRSALSGGNSSTKGGNTLPSRLSSPCRRYHMKSEAFSCLTSTDRHLRFCWLETSWDDWQQLSSGQRSSAGKVGLDERTLWNVHNCHAYFRTRSEARMDWRAQKAHSHFFHWYQSHMAGFHEILEAVHCIWQCLTEEAHNNVDEQAGYVLRRWCSVYFDEKDVRYVQMFIVYVAFESSHDCCQKLVVSCHILLQCIASLDECI